MPNLGAWNRRRSVKCRAPSRREVRKAVPPLSAESSVACHFPLRGEGGAQKDRAWTWVSLTTYHMSLWMIHSGDKAADELSQPRWLANIKRPIGTMSDCPVEEFANPSQVLDDIFFPKHCLDGVVSRRGWGCGEEVIDGNSNDQKSVPVATCV